MANNRRRSNVSSSSSSTTGSDDDIEFPEWSWADVVRGSSPLVRVVEECITCNRWDEQCACAFPLKYKVVVLYKQRNNSD
jgi:hypothetical protein